MKILSLLMVLLLGPLAQATTTGRFVGPQMLIGLVSHSYDGSTDSSPQRLYELMNRPEQPSHMGPGKSLDTEKKILNFVCNNRGGGQYACAINIHKSAFSSISAGKASFEVLGPAAQAYFHQFHSQNGVFQFRDDSQLFLIEATPERFLIVFSTSGV